GPRDLEREALADESSEFRLMFERVDAGNDAARAVTEKKHRQAGFAGLDQRHDGPDVAGPVGKFFDVEPLAVRLPATPQIDRVYRETVGRQLLGDPSVIAAVSFEAGNDNDHTAGICSRTPRANEDVETIRTFDFFFVHRIDSRF